MRIKNNINRHYEFLDELAQQFKVKLPPSAAEIHSNPIILCLGNHSSGKSAFINHILGQDIQESSIAPLDDCFTLFSFGKPFNVNQNYVEQSGEGLVLNKKLPFRLYQDIYQFGTKKINFNSGSLVNVKGKFLHRVKLKYVQEKKLEEIMLVDSPGMIDSFNQQRDYDFYGAVQWFSERADIILFFFDPDKPGTSGESLQIFSQVKFEFLISFYFLIIIQ